MAIATQSTAAAGKPVKAVVENKSLLEQDDTADIKTDTVAQQKQPMLHKDQMSSSARLLLQAYQPFSTSSDTDYTENDNRKNATIDHDFPAQTTANFTNEPSVNGSPLDLEEGHNTTSIHTAYHLLPEATNTSNELYSTVTQQYCDIHNFSQYIDTSDHRQYECWPVKGMSSLRICLYPSNFDVDVSGSIRKSGAWEPRIAMSIRNALKRYPKSTFLDIGANIGMHTLVMANLGNDVIAVEPKWSTIKRLHKSVNLNHLSNRITLVTNGISDVRNNLTLYCNGHNQGGSTMIKNAASHCQETIKTILMDDLLEVLHRGQQLVIKMDIEGSECHALVHSQRFFSSVKVNVIFMEWMKMKTNLKKNTDTELTRDMVKKLRDLGFEPRAVDSSFTYSHPQAFYSLEDKDMLKWPHDIVWIKSWDGIIQH